MASTYVNDLRLNELATGDASGSWGTITNTNLELIAEAFSFGTEAIPTNVTNSTHTTTIADGATDPGRSMFLTYTGSQNANVTVTLAPNTVSKMWFIENATTGSSVNLIIKQGSGATVTIPHGQTKAIYSDGAGSGAKIVDAFASLSVVDLKVQDDLTVTDDVAIGGLATVGGTLGVTGIATFTDDIIIGDGKTIGSASTVGAITIASDGDIALTGVVTANAGVVVDEMTLDGDTLTATDTFTIDAVDDIILNSDNSGRILFGDASILYGIVLNSSSNFVLEVGTSDKDMLFKGQDGGASITALTLDMSAAGQAQFTNGTDALPSISFASDPDTGIRRGGTNNLAFVANGATRTYIDASTHLATSTAGTSNLALGVNAGNSIASGGNYNVVVGDEAGTAITLGDKNTAVGFTALNAEVLGSQSTAVGYQALFAQNIGSQLNMDNTAVGYNAGSSTTNGARNTFIGSSAGLSANTDDVVCIGFNAGGGNAMTGHDNVLVGKDSGASLIAGNGNVMVGRDAGQASTTAAQNTFIGEDAGFTNAGGDTNTFVGSDSGYLSLGDGNTYIGKNAGESMTDGSENTFIGSYNGNQNGLDIRTSDNNVVLSDGDANIHFRSVQVSSTQRQIELNKYGSGSSNQDFMTFLGRDSSQPAAANSHGLILSNGHSGAQAKFYAYGQSSWTALEFLNTHGHTGQQIGSIKLTENATSFETSSDYRLKENVNYTWDATTRLKQLKPARFNWISDSTNTLIDGFLAHEVSSIVPEAISGDKDAVDDNGNPDLQGIDQSKLVPLLVKAIQELEARIAVLEG